MVKVLFVDNMWIESGSILILSAILKKYGHECELIIGDKKKVRKKIKSYKPDLVAFSCMNMKKKWLVETTHTIKRTSNIPIIVGGSICLSSPEIIKLQSIDAICIGEGDYAILEVANSIDKKEDFSNTPNLIVKKDGHIKKNKVTDYVDDLNKLPFFDREIYYKYSFFKKSNHFELFFASRGCAFACKFCFYNTLKKHYGKMPIRRRSPENVIEEIKSVKKIKNLRRVYFEDSIFINNKQWTIKFLKLYRTEINLPFICHGHFNFLDEDIVPELKKSKCHNIYLGVESGDETIRNKTLDKKIKTSKIMDVSKMLHKYKLRFTTLNMMGLPGETYKQAKETIRLNQQIKPTCIAIDLFIPYPRLDITNEAIKKKFLNSTSLNALSNTKHLYRSILKQRDIKEISNLNKFSFILFRFRFLEPVVNLLVKLPENKLFDIIYAGSYYFELKRIVGWRFQEIFYDIYKNYKAFF